MTSSATHVVVSIINQLEKRLFLAFIHQNLVQHFLGPIY